MDSNLRKLYVDDIRPCPIGWELALTFHDAIYMLDNNEYAELSLDHDLASFYGNTELTGYHIVGWLIHRRHIDKYVPPIIHVHSANPVGSRKMREDITRYLSNEL